MSMASEKTLIGDVGRIVVVAAFFIGLSFLLQISEVRKILFDLDTFRVLLHVGDSSSDYLISAVFFVLAGSCLIAMGIPRLWASAVGGAIYGAFIGTLLSILASLVGASILYHVGKYFLAQVVERRMGERMKLWQKRFQQNAFWWVLYARIFPFSNSTLLSLFCGCNRVTFSSYLQGSLLGFIPLAVAFSAFGSGGIKGNFYQIGFATAILSSVIVIRRLLNRRISPPSDDKGPHLRVAAEEPLNRP